MPTNLSCLNHHLEIHNVIFSHCHCNKLRTNSARKFVPISTLPRCVNQLFSMKLSSEMDLVVSVRFFSPDRNKANKHKIIAATRHKCSRLSSIAFFKSKCFIDLYTIKVLINKNAFQSKAHLPLAKRKSNTYNLTLEWPWSWDDLDLVYNLDLRQVKLS